MSLHRSVLSDLADRDQVFLRRLGASLNLLADLSYADLFLFLPAGEGAEIVAEGRPEPLPSLYSESQLGRRRGRAEIPAVFKVLFDGRTRRHYGGVVVNGIPVMQEVFAIRNGLGETVAALVSEMAMVEHERLRKRSALYRLAISRVRDLVIAGRLEGCEKLGRLGVHDGVMVIDGRGQIQYISATAEHLYRRLGYGDSLVKTQLSELDTNEYVCFRAIERGICLEQRVQEQDLIWIKRAIPLLPAEERSLFSRLNGSDRIANGAVVVIQDVTDEVQKERELEIKSAMIREIHHRVKNNLQAIAALVRMQLRRSTSPELTEQLSQTVNRILSVAVVHEYLSRDELEIINIHEVCNRILEEVMHGTLDPDKKITLHLEGIQQFYLPAKQATSCALVINELVQNAVEHGYQHRQEGTIVVRLEESDDTMTIEIRDDGAGLPEGFDLEQSGLGLRIVRTLVRSDLKGQFVLENGNGVCARASFPRWRSDESVGPASLVGAAAR